MELLVGRRRCRAGLLWARFWKLDRNLDGYAERRPGVTTVVVPEPQAAI
jgi:hypothetical protein